MNNKYILLGGAVVTALTFAACQPQQTSMMTGDTIETPSPIVLATDQSPLLATEEGVMVGGAMMLETRPITVNAADAQNLTTLVAALKQAELDTTLAGPGPFTVFAPTNDAFAKLPASTWPGLLEPTMAKQLKSVLTYHVVPGKYDVASLTNGQKLTTVQGEVLTVVIDGGKVMIKDSLGNTANVETADVMQSNGVVHVIDAVMVPKKM